VEVRKNTWRQNSVDKPQLEHLFTETEDVRFLCHLLETRT